MLTRTHLVETLGNWTADVPLETQVNVLCVTQVPVLAAQSETQ